MKTLYAALLRLHAAACTACEGERTPDLQNGKDLYTIQCARCHGHDGSGNIVDFIAFGNSIEAKLLPLGALHRPEEQRAIIQQGYRVLFKHQSGFSLPLELMPPAELGAKDTEDVLAYTQQLIHDRRRQ